MCNKSLWSSRLKNVPRLNNFFKYHSPLTCLFTRCLHRNIYTHSATEHDRSKDIRAGEFWDYGKHVLTWTWIWRSYFWNTENKMDYTHTHNTHIDRMKERGDLRGIKVSRHGWVDFHIWSCYITLSSLECEVKSTHAHSAKLKHDQQNIVQFWVQYNKKAIFIRTKLSLEQITPCQHVHTVESSQKKQHSEFEFPPVNFGINKFPIYWLQMILIDCSPL